jgi:hypothetical protein
MKNIFFLMVLVSLTLQFTSSAHAHGTAGNRVFPPTLTVDDPSVADELSLPTFSHQRQNAAPDGSAPSTRTSDLGIEWDKRITENLGIGFNADYLWISPSGDVTQRGWDNVSLTLKYLAYVNPDHEFMTSVGVSHEFGDTGAKQIASSFGSTTPKLYFGKGLGDLPIGYLRPLAITGLVGYTVFETNDSDTHNEWNFGWTVQYSIPYLQQHVVDLGLPGFIAKLTPVIEFNVTSNQFGPATGTIAPGVLYTDKAWQFGVEALIPYNRASNTDIGVIAQFHLFLDDLFPHSLGKPIF